MKGIIQPSLYSLREKLKDMVAELLEPHLSIHPITYNDYLTETVQEIQTNRHKRKFDQVSRGVVTVDTTTVNSKAYHDVPLRNLLLSLLQATTPDVREYSASLCADVAEAYYTVF